MRAPLRLLARAGETPEARAHRSGRFGSAAPGCASAPLRTLRLGYTERGARRAERLPLVSWPRVGSGAPRIGLLSYGTIARDVRTSPEKKYHGARSRDFKVATVDATAAPSTLASTAGRPRARQLPAVAAVDTREAPRPKATRRLIDPRLVPGSGDPSRRGRCAGESMDSRWP